MDTLRKHCRNGIDVPLIIVLYGSCVFVVLQLMNGISNGNAVSYIPRILAVYPVSNSSNQQLMEFTKTWQNYGSVKQLQVCIITLQCAHRLFVNSGPMQVQ